MSHWGQTLILWVISLTYFTKEVLSYTELNVGYPAMAMHYKMYVDAGREYCVFQYTHPGDVFFVDFFVIRGGDLKARFAVKDPQGIEVLPYQFTSKVSYQTENAVGGYYAICTDNDSKYSTKLIGYLMGIYEPEGWGRFINDLTSIDADAQNVTKAFKVISERVTNMTKYLHGSKSLEARDYGLLAENHFNVAFWSFVQFIIILGSGITQVYIIRQFFKDKPSYGKYKVRL